jgi:hypothetical protein
MLMELEANKLEVILVPSRVPECAADGGKIRVAVSQNVGWYRRLCSDYPVPSSRKKKRTTVKRREVIRVLVRLASGKETKSKYKDYLEEVALKLQEDLQEDIGFYMGYGELPVPFDDQF